MMSQHTNPWEKEYRNPRLLSLSETPQKEVLNFLKKYLPKHPSRVLDIGCGVGASCLYVAERGHHATGLDVSETALSIAKERSLARGYHNNFLIHDIRFPLPTKDSSFDIVIDCMTSHCLSEKDYKSYAQECLKVASPGAYIFIKTLAREGDKHASYLIKNSPGTHPGSYRYPELNFEERPHTEAELREVWKDFNLISLAKKASYTPCGGRSYKRMTWTLILQKPFEQETKD